MVPASHQPRSATSRLLAIGVGALGGLLTLYVYSFAYVILGPHPAGATIGLEHLPVVVDIALYTAWGLAVPAALFGAATIGAASFLSRRLPALPTFAFAGLSACIMGVAAYLTALVSAPFSGYQLQKEPWIFVAFAGFAFVAAGCLRWRHRIWAAAA